MPTHGPVFAPLQPIAKDTAVLKVPMHLAIADQTAEAPAGSGDSAPAGEGPALYEGAPWSVRLAARLLQLRGEGAACPWYPYIQVLQTVAGRAGCGGGGGPRISAQSCLAPRSYSLPPAWLSAHATETLLTVWLTHSLPLTALFPVPRRSCPRRCPRR